LLPDATRISSIVAGHGTSQDVEVTGLGVLARVSLDGAGDVLRALRDEGFGFLVDLFASDTGESVEVTYHLRSLGRNEDVFVRTTLGYGGVLPSVWEIYPAAAFPEREAAELFGFKLSGHPNPKRLLTTAGCPPYLRKDESIRDVEEVRRR